MTSSQPIFELIVAHENNTKQRYQCLTRDDGPGYWLSIAEWCDESWQTVRREPLAAIELNTFDHSHVRSSTSLVECPVCGRVGLPERIVQHDCTTGSTH